MRVKRHPFAVWTLAWSPDSAQIASAGQSREVWLWDARTLRTRLITRQRHLGVSMLAWSPDGKRLAVGCRDGAITLWDTQSGALLLSYGLHRRSVSALAWSPDGSQIASSSADSFLHIWSASTGKRVFFRRNGYYRESRHREAHALAWSPDGRYLAAGSWFPVLTLWDVTTGGLVEWMWDEDHVLFSDTLTWPFRGQRLLCSYTGAPLAFFKGERLFADGHARTLEEVAPSPDGHYLAVPSRRNYAVRIRRAIWRSREDIFLYGGHRQPITALEWSPDGTCIASADQGRNVHLWQPDLSQSQPPRPKDARLAVDGIAFTEETDFAAFARVRLLGSASSPDTLPLDWFCQALSAFERSPLLDLLTEGLAACLTAPEPIARVQALRFFQQYPSARGAERIPDLVAGDRALYAGVPNPLDGAADLESALLGTLSSLIAIRDERALEVAQAEVLTPGRALPLIAPLTAANADWVIKHAGEIVEATPQAGISMLVELQRVWRGVSKVGKRIAPLAARDPHFFDDVERLITDPDAKRRILEAARGGS